MPPHADPAWSGSQPRHGSGEVAEAPFAGFRSGALAVTFPAELFTDVLPAIDDEAELRVTLYTLYAIARSRGEPRAARRSQLEGELPLRELLDGIGGRQALTRGLEAAVARGVLLSCETDDGDSYYFVNNDGGRRQRERMLAGAIDMPARPLVRRADVTTSRPASVYEAEIGMLTPSVSSALAEMEAKLPERWIVDAIRLAARRNARSWVYVEAVLRRWEVEGRDDEAAERAADGSRSGPRDPYDHVVRRRFD